MRVQGRNSTKKEGGDRDKVLLYSRTYMPKSVSEPPKYFIFVFILYSVTATLRRRPKIFEVFIPELHKNSLFQARISKISVQKLRRCLNLYPENNSAPKAQRF